MEPDRWRPNTEPALRPVLDEAQGVGHQDRHELLRREDAERPARAIALREAADLVGPAVAAGHERGDGLPAVAGQYRGRGVVARDGEDVGLEGEDAGQLRVE